MLMDVPWTGLLKDRPFMHEISDAVVDYCKWWSPDFPRKARKRTDIFRVGADYTPSRQLCNFGSGHCTVRRHDEWIGSSSGLRQIRCRSMTYRIPPLLCADIARWAAKNLHGTWRENTHDTLQPWRPKRPSPHRRTS
jgi:hypothetical protein